MSAPRNGALEAFAEAVGVEGAVTVVGGRTQWDVGGASADGARAVVAPSGVVEHVPAEMTVRVGAGTAVEALDEALAAAGQTVALPAWPGATVGGVLAVGRSGLRRLGWGPVRDTLLEARYESAEGRLVKAGGPTVKNVSGYDLCRLLVGSLGTLGLLGEVVLRTRPLPSCSRWFTGSADPFLLRGRLYRPSAILWDGRTTWVLLEGHTVDVEAEAAVLADHGLSAADGPPVLPPHRGSVTPARVAALEGAFVAEVGVGTVHRPRPGPASEVPPVPPAVAALCRRVKHGFDPAGRLNPGRDPLVVA